MLEIGNKTITVEGITVFADHADPNQFWYLPGPVSLARRPQDNRAAFTLIKYGDVENGTVDGRGFLMFEVNLALDPDIERRIISRLSSIAPDRPKLTAVPFDEGTVECIALDLQGSGGTTAQVTDEGTFQAVESILGATTPSLHGDNRAAFSLSLSQEGTTILESVFEGGGAPVGAVYNLTYTGLRPALEVEITTSLKRVYDHFSANLEGQYMFLRAGIEAGFEKLVQDGVIQIKVINYSTEADRAEKETWALDFFKEKLLADWFRPSLTPGQLAGGMATAEGLDNVRRRGEELRPRPAPAPAPGNNGSNSGNGSTGTGTTGNGATGTTGAGNGSTDGTDSAGNGARQGADQGTGAAEEPVQMPNPAVTAANTANAVAAATAMPPVSSPAAPVQAAGLQFPPRATPSAANNPMDSAVVSFKLKYIKQIEEKTLTFRYTRAEAVRRTYAPQGFFGLLAQDLSREGHFFEIDGDDAFFREFKVSIETPFNKQRIGLASAHVQLEYGEADSENPKRGDFVIDEESDEKLEWLVKTIPGVSQYKYDVQYHFDPDADWQGERLSYELPPIITEDRTLMVHPFDRLGFLEIEVSPSLIDWSAVSDVEVKLSYESPEGWNPKKSLFFTEATAGPQSWKLRLTDPEFREYTYQCIYRLKDGSQRSSEPMTTETTRILVPNPFFAIELEFLPLYLPGDVRTIFIDIEYDDEDNGLEIIDRVRLDGSGADSVPFKLNVVDPSKRNYRYRLTIVGNDGSLNRGQFIETSETLIGVDAI